MWSLLRFCCNLEMLQIPEEDHLHSRTKQSQALNREMGKIFTWQVKIHLVWPESRLGCLGQKVGTKLDVCCSAVSSGSYTVCGALDSSEQSPIES